MARKKKEEKQKIIAPKYEESKKDTEKQGIILDERTTEGLSVLVELIEEVEVQQDHEANINQIGFNGKLLIENPSSIDRVWDIDISLTNTENTNLESNEIKIKELGISEEEKSYAQEFQLMGEIKNLLLVKEYINTNPNADDILNPKDIEGDLLKLKQKVSDIEVETIEKKEERIEKTEEEKIEVKNDSDIEDSIDYTERKEEDYEEGISSDFETPYESIKRSEEESSTELEDLDKNLEFFEEDEEKKDFEQWSIQELREYCEDNLIDIPDDATKEEILEKIREAEEEMLEGGIESEEYSLESYGISINKSNEVTFVIALQSLYEKEILNVKIEKIIPSEFKNINIKSSSLGNATIEENKIIWRFDRLEPENTVFLKFICDVFVETLEPVKTGLITIMYQAQSSFSGGLTIDKFEGFTRNKYYIDLVEKEEEPGVWDCNLVFQNPSEFMIELLEINVNDPKNPQENFISIPKETLPKLSSGAEWHSDHWDYKSDDYPSFKKKLAFRVLPSFETRVNSTISIEDINLVLASITGAITYEAEELPITIEEEKQFIIIPSYKDSEIQAHLTLENNGSAPLNEITLTQSNFNDEFKPPTSEEIKLFWDGKQVELEPESILIDEESLKISLVNLKDSPTGMLDPNSKIDVLYPVHAESPPQDREFKTNAIYTANTYPRGAELEFIPTPEVIPIIKVVHIRRKYRIGKEIIPIESEGNYQIILHYQNVGDMPLKNFTLLDKVPDNFEYKNFSLEPTDITDENGTDVFKWIIDSLDAEEKLEISYEISGSGEYHASEAQLSF